MLLELEKRFCSEESRIAYLAALRWPGGWSCPCCSATEGWTVRRNRWRCGHCRYEMSMRAIGAPKSLVRSGVGRRIKCSLPLLSRKMAGGSAVSGCKPFRT
ncbi:MAG: transposase [Acidobacteriaceae bacterium]